MASGAGHSTRRILMRIGTERTLYRTYGAPQFIRAPYPVPSAEERSRLPS